MKYRKLILVFIATLFSLMKMDAQWTELGGNNSFIGLFSNSYWIRNIFSDQSDNIYVTGGFVNGSNQDFIAKYDGVSWSELGGANSVGIGPYFFSAICSDKNGNIYVGGLNYVLVSRVVIKFNGTSWSQLGSPIAGVNGTEINSICSDVAGNIYAAGSFANSNGKRYVAKFNGTFWSELGRLDSLGTIGAINKITTDKNGNVYAVGGFLNASGKGFVAKYNGSSWSELGGYNSLNENSPYGSAYVICLDTAGNVYVGGEFHTKNNVYYIKKYDGNSWKILGDTSIQFCNNYIHALSSDKYGNIYKGGYFTNAGFRFVAKFDGSNWSELGGTNSLKANNTIFSIVSDSKGNIYTAGGFKNDSNKLFVGKNKNCPASPLTLLNMNVIGKKYIFGTKTLTISGIYYDTLKNKEGCDSILKLTLNISCPASPLTSITKNIVGSSYVFGLKTLTHSGTYYDTVKNSIGCDSVLKLSLTLTSGIVNSEMYALSISPNPCRSCELIVSKHLKTDDLHILDVTGREVSASFEKMSKGYLIKMPIESIGFYFLINSQSGQIIRFLKE